MLKPRSLVVLVGLVLAGSAGAVTRLDAALHAVSRYPELALRLVPKSPQVRGQVQAESAATGGQTVSVLLRFEGDGLAKAKAAGARVRTVSGNVASVDIPATQLGRVAELPGVVYVEAAKRLRLRLDQSVPATHADTLRTGSGASLSGVTGKGVVVGIVDDGIDFRHQDFRNADGTTRLLQLWDMRAAGAAGTPPTGYSYGGVCTADMINKALQGLAGGCKEPSSGGHGTHVAGIAAGNGGGTGNGLAAYRLVGMAPQADIVGANPLGSGVAVSSDTAVIDGVNYVKQVAQNLGEPAVVNLSLGSYYGSRDGTSNYETALSNAVAPGFFIVGAVGNEAQAPIRATGTIQQGQTVDIGYKVPDGTQTYYLEMWYPGKQAFSVRVRGPGNATGCDSGTVAAASAAVTKDTACGTIIVSSADTSPLNDDRQILIALQPTTDSSVISTGTWTVSLTADSLGQASTTFSMIGAEAAGEGEFTNYTEYSTSTPNGIVSQIITDTASATNVIGVGAYVTKTAWTSVNGHQYNTASYGQVGDIAAFSSRGPRRDCSNLSKCPQAMKPEIVAPGAAISSSLASDYTVSQKYIDQDGVHLIDLGTSMATPHVTGAIALLLQRNPKLTLSQLRSALFGTIQTNGFTTQLPVYNAQTLLPQSPNYTWGYGILDAAAAYQYVASQVATPTFLMHRVATADQVSYSATITPETVDVGSKVNIYVAAVSGGTLYVRDSAGGWSQYASVIPVAGTATATSSFNVDIATLPLAYNASLAGTQILVGYGKDVNDMLNNAKFGTIGSVQ